MTVKATSTTKPENIILESVVGSIAYGLDTASSDEDVMGVFVAPTSEILSLYEVKVTPKIREELFAIGKLEPAALVDRFAKEFAEFDKIQSVLPDEPNKAEVDKLLLRIRKGYW